MVKWKKTLRHFSMALIFTAFVFISMLVSMLLVLGIMRVLAYSGIIAYPDSFHQPLLLFAIVSLLVGTCVALFISHRPLRPWYILTNAANEIANGNYQVRVHTNGPEAVQDLFGSFNHMAEELGSVEMLRSDFVNNFSHEFKTPIVSIRGFAKMLQRNDLTEEERKEYLDIIISESERLSNLADNVLSLSKIEQQTILSEKEYFNVSEQIRLVIAMVLSKWSQKDVDISLDGDEVYLTGNKELLRQVWINLLDNAIKFSPDHVRIDIRITKKNDITISFTDHGFGMNQDTMQHIFEKFYQGDTSHTVKGNGLGLPLSKRIIELHDGSISVSSKEGKGTTFLITLNL